MLSNLSSTNTKRKRVGRGGSRGFTKPNIAEMKQEDAVKAVQKHGEKMRIKAASFRQSILQDADRNRRLEVNETLGHTLTLATELGVATSASAARVIVSSHTSGKQQV